MAKENNFIDLVFVVNGEDVDMPKLNIHESLHAARNKALADSGNTGRPPRLGVVLGGCQLACQGSLAPSPRHRWTMPTSC